MYIIRKLKISIFYKQTFLSSHLMDVSFDFLDAFLENDQSDDIYEQQQGTLPEFFDVDSITNSVVKQFAFDALNVLEDDFNEAKYGLGANNVKQ